MKRQSFILFNLVVAVAQISFAQKYESFFTPDTSIIDTFFNHYIIEDKYRWLEDVSTQEVKDWIKKQNKLSDKYLSKAKSTYTVEEWIRVYADVKYNFPIKKGKYYFDVRSQEIYYRKKFDGTPIALVGIGNSFSKNIKLIEDFSVSRDSKLLAYQYSTNGSDRMELRVLLIEAGVHLKDHLVGLRFGKSITWRGDGFYYTRYADNEYFGQVPEEKVYYHKIGTEQSEDELIFDKSDTNSSFYFYVIDEEQYLILYDMKAVGKKYNIYYIDFESENKNLTPILTNINDEVKIGIIGIRNGKFIAVTDFNEKKEYVVEIDPNNPYNLRKIIPAFEDAEPASIIPKEDKLFIQYKSGFTNYIMVYNYSGEALVKLQLPPFSSIGKFSSGEDDDELIYSITSYTLPNVVYSLNTKTYENKPLDNTVVNFDYTTIEYKQVEYLSKDSTVVPMTLVYEKGLKLDGNNPAILYTYGGFGIVEKPSFNPAIAYFVKNGGIFAFAHVRGSGEKGEEWAKEGKGLKKQNTFDDFISGAEYLIKEHYTTADKLTATGSSHGGLVVAAAAIQRSDLFKAVVSDVAVLDMLRFEKYTVGKNWVDEFGSVKDSIEFVNLLSYSPYHNIKEDVNYPTMLIFTSESDDRVPPFHSYKFAARLQNRVAQTNPIYLSIQEKAGHSGTSYIDKYVFLITELIKKK